MDAYKIGEFDENELKHIYKVKDRIIEEIKNKTNKCMNIDYMKYLTNF